MPWPIPYLAFSALLLDRPDGIRPAESTRARPSTRICSELTAEAETSQMTMGPGFPTVPVHLEAALGGSLGR